jgi:hypothetical protein
MHWTRAANCPRPAIRLDKIEVRIDHFYQTFELPPQRVEALRRAVHAEMAHEVAKAHERAETANKRLAKLHDERTQLRHAHYAGAVPLDLMKTEQHYRAAPANIRRQINQGFFQKLSIDTNGHVE